MDKDYKRKIKKKHTKKSKKEDIFLHLRTFKTPFILMM